MSQASIGADVHGQGGDILSVEIDSALRGWQLAGDDVKERAFAGAVWADDSMPIAMSYLQVNFLKGQDAPEMFAQIPDFKLVHDGY
jgi:hypothetical protein